jgi:hypothetical protein
MFIRRLASTLSNTEENLTHDNKYQEKIHTQLHRLRFHTVIPFILHFSIH